MLQRLTTSLGYLRPRALARSPRPNSALIFLNSKGAHGASIPDDAEPADLQRYAYQFRIGPTRAGMEELMAALPAERAAAWSGKPASY